MFRKRKRKAKAKERLGSTAKAQLKKKKVVEEQNEEEDLEEQERQEAAFRRLQKRLKRRKMNDGLTFSNVRKKESIDVLAPTVKSTRSAMPAEGVDQGATVKTEVHERFKRNDGKQTMQNGKELYTGLKDYMHKAQHQDKEGVGRTKRIGPLRAPANHQPTCIFDYNPSICKDYKETGHCGYGLSCKFLHDRTDYKAGWQLEKDWEAQQERRARQAKGEEVTDSESDYEITDDEELPFACHICREPFEDPIKTNCGHFFCKKCAMKSYKKTPGCRVCGENTEGIFMTATEIIRRQKKMA